MTAAMTTQHPTLESFFFEEIELAQRRCGQSLSPQVEAYVVGLLARYARRPHAAGRRSRALALDYLRARDTAGSARANALRTVGDRALYISGVAPRSLDRSPVDVGYVRGIGEAAYREVANRGAWGSALEVLGELAEGFEGVSEVIGTVVDLDGNKATADLLGVYERWRAHGDPRDRRRLLEAGVLLDPAGSDQVQ